MNTQQLAIFVIFSVGAVFSLYLFAPHSPMKTTRDNTQFDEGEIIPAPQLPDVEQGNEKPQSVPTVTLATSAPVTITPIKTRLFRVTRLSNMDVFINGTMAPNVTSEQDTIQPPLTPRTDKLLQVLPPPHSDYGHLYLGRHESLLVFCEFFSVTYSVWLLDCLPRLLYVMHETPQLINSKIGCTGEYFTEQWFTEILGFERDNLLLLPSHIIWMLKYPQYHLTVDTVQHIALTWSPLVSQHKHKTAHLPFNNENDALLFPFLQQFVFSKLPRGEGHAVWSGNNKDYGGLRVVLSERMDMTMPFNYSNFVSQLGKQSESVGLDLHIVTLRLEQLTVINQIQLVRDADVLIGPCCGSNLVNAVFMSPGSMVLELFSGVNENGELEVDGSRKRPKYEEHDSSGRPTDIQMLCEVMQLKYAPIDAIKIIADKAQPHYDVMHIVDAIKQYALKRGKGVINSIQQRSEAVTQHPTGEVLGCQHLFHLKDRGIGFMGLYKQTYVVPKKFALKVPRTGEWRRVLKEMVLLRNLTLPQINSYRTECFDIPKPMYAQWLYKEQLGKQGSNRPDRISSNSSFFGAVAGYLSVWRLHERLGNRFLFYCDAGPKNWAINLDNKLQMYDFDTAMIIPSDTLCANDNDCGCGPSVQPVCVNNQCTASGMFEKTTRLVHGWLSGLIVEMMPVSLRADHQPSRDLLRAAKSGALQCSDIVNFLKQSDASYLNDIPACDDATPLSLTTVPADPTRGRRGSHHKKKPSAQKKEPSGK